MSIPAPIRAIEAVIEKFSYPVITIGAAVCFSLLVLFLAAGPVFPNHDSPFWDTPLETAGLFLTMAVLPAYLLMCFTAWHRSSRLLFRAIERQLPEPGQTGITRFAQARYWPVAVVFGMIYALWFNLNWSSLSFDPGNQSFIINICLVFGQLLMWSVVAMVLFFIIHEDLVLYRSGKLIQVNLYDLDSLNGFGRAGLNGLLMVVGALALTTLQSLDAEFRLDNYIYALYVGVPAAIVMVFLPIWTVRDKIRQEKERELLQVDEAIRNSSASLDTESLTRLNALLGRREQIQHQRNWPMDISIFTRFVLYVFIPPLAWIGAALMEVFLDSMLVG